MKSYIKFLSRNKLYTAIEAVGLTVSLAFVILIGTYVWQQYRIAYENPDYERVYAVSGESYFGAGYFDKEVIDDEVPEVEASARYSIEGQPKAFMVNGEVALAVPAFIEKDFFNVFPQYDLLEGSPDVLDDPSNVIVSRTFADKISSDGASVIGMPLSDVGNPGKIYTIAGVMEDFDKTLFNYSDLFFNIRETGLEQYGFNVIGLVATFLRVAEGTDRGALQEKLKPLYEKNYHSVTPVLHRIDEVYFLSESYMTNKVSPSLLRILLAVVLALLISAVFNYINLTFALTGKRAKEMATRRLVGASQSDIFIKNILESVGFTIVCFAFALMLAIALVPTMNSLLIGERQNVVPLSLELSSGYVMVCIISAVLLGAAAGLMPSLNTLRFKPIDIIKGSFRREDKRLFTKIFIVVQNALSMILIAMAILMEVQLSHMASRPMNANMDNLFYLESAQAGMTYDAGIGVNVAQPLIDRLERIPEVNAVGIGDGCPGGMIMDYEIPHDDGKPHTVIKAILCDSTYFRLIAPEIVMDFNYPLAGSVWLSESAAAAVDFSDSTSANLARYFYAKDVASTHVGGIFRDIPTRSAAELDMNSNGAIVVRRPEDFTYGCRLLISTVSESREVADKILAEYDAYAKDTGIYGPPYIARFLNDGVKKDLAPVTRTIRLVELFMVLSVILSLLGLVAMSTHFSEQKSKEIAIRKVFGGTVRTETLSSVRSYMIMVGIACVIGVPIAVYASGRYLDQFAYRIENYWWIFVLAVVLSFAISLLSVLWQTLKSARTNPATELKKE